MKLSFRAVRKIWASQKQGLMMTYGGNFSASMSQGRPYSWQTAIFMLGAALLLLFATHWAAVSHLVSIWWSVDIYSHGLLTPLFALLILSERRSDGFQGLPQANFRALAGLFISLFLLRMGEQGEAQLIAHMGLYLAVFFTVFAFFGWHLVRQFAPVFLVLFLGLPVGGILIAPLQIFTAKIVISVLDILGLVLQTEGVRLTLSSGVYEIAEACAGIKFFFTSAVMGIFLCLYMLRTRRARLILLAISVLLPVMANALRVLGILLVAEVTGQAFAKNIDHIIYGWGFLTLVLLALITFAFLLSKREKKHVKEAVRPSKPGAEGKSVPADSGKKAVVMIVCCGVGFFLSYQFLSLKPLAEQRSTCAGQRLQAPDVPGYRQLRVGEFDGPVYPHAALTLAGRYRLGGDHYRVAAAYYASANSKAGYLSDWKDPAGKGWQALITSLGATSLGTPSLGATSLGTTSLGIETILGGLPYRRAVFAQGEKRRLMRELVFLNGKPVAGRTAFKLRQFLLNLQRQPTETVVIRIFRDIDWRESFTAGEADDPAGAIEEFVLALDPSMIKNHFRNALREKSLCVE